MRFKTNTTIVLIACIATMLPFTSCKKKQQNPPEENPVIVPTSSTEIACKAEGGVFDITYKIENPLEDGSVHINGLPVWAKADKSGDRIRLAIHPNDSEEARESECTVAYGNNRKTTSFNMKILQEGMKKEEEDPLSIAITVKETGYDYVMAEALPSTEELHCIALVTEKQYFDSFASEKEFFASEIQYFTRLSEETGFKISEVITKLGGKGLREVKVDRLKRGTDYCCYSYFITVSDTPELLSAIFRKDFRTLEPEPEKCEFEIKVEPSATEAKIHVTPQNNDQLYYFYAESVENVELSEGEDFKAKLGAYIEEMLHFFIMTGRPLTDILSKGPDSDIAYDLSPDKKHVAFATGVNEQGMITTDITYLEFSTLPAARRSAEGR